MSSQTPATISPLIEKAYQATPISESSSAPVGQSNGLDLCQNGTDQYKAQVKLGRGRPPLVSQPAPARASPSRVAGANVELILYSYAQLSGMLSISPLADQPLTTEQLQNLQSLRRTLLNTKAVGGGSMDITSHSPRSFATSAQLSMTARRPVHTRSTSLSSGLRSLLSPAPAASILPTSFSTQQSSNFSHHRRTSSLLSSLFPGSTRLNGLGLNAASIEEEIDADVPLPTYEVQPTMLAVDLLLGPGESRTCACIQSSIILRAVLNCENRHL